MKTTITGAIYANQYYQGDDISYTFFDFTPSEVSGWIRVVDHAIEVEIPGSFDIRAGQIEALRAKESQVRADFAKTITDIQRQISELQAIGCEVSA